ncbi:hypothetical protein L1987_60961 [Smallanthus sonchifolius]|uniref:Uncharacterized protein n=1 Tax=Smallanthus sonchifolius TaxID=185202 RepID=A0ACB9D9V1_9ASTR|nr:hypothetical protein L1987_60961 [Smallanthus sonchifolius]
MGLEAGRRPSAIGFAPQWICQMGCGSPGLKSCGQCIGGGSYHDEPFRNTHTIVVGISPYQRYDTYLSGVDSPPSDSSFASSLHDLPELDPK